MTAVRGVVVLGAGGHSKVVVATLQAAGQRVDGIFDDASEKWGTQLLGVPVVGSLSAAGRVGAKRAVVAVGDNRTRKRLAASCETLEWISVVHPAAIVHPTARLGPGTVVFAGAVIQPDTVVQGHCIVNTGATIDHDCRLADFVHLAPGVALAGGVELGEGVLMGVGSSAVPNVTVGAWSVVGGGAVVTRDLPPGVTAVGVPAKPTDTEGGSVVGDES